MIIKFAEEIDEEKVINFFNEYITKENSWIISEEFLCPYWIKWAIKRKQIIIIKTNEDILWALRFYPRKRDNICSLYQFALNDTIRWKDLIKKMLFFTWYKTFQVQIFINSPFNNYYLKQNWKLSKSNEKYNYWELNI